MIKKIKKANNFKIYEANNELDLLFFDFKIWKSVVLFLGLVSMIVTSVFYFQITIKYALYIFALVCFALFPIVNLYFNISYKRLICDSLFIILSATLIAVSRHMLIAELTLLFFDVYKFIDCFLWIKDKNDSSSAIKLLPDYALIAKDGKAEKIKPSRIKKGDIVCVYQNEIVPIDGKVAEGNTKIDYSSLTGDAYEVSVLKGSTVLSGGINISEPIIIIAECDYNECFVQRVFDICDDSLDDDTRELSLIKKILTYSIPAFFILGIILCVIVPLFKHDWSKSLEIAAALLILSSPNGICGLLYKYLYLAVEYILRNGVVLSNGLFIEHLANVKTVICNKTSTVTETEYEIEDVEPYGITIDNFLSLVLKVESSSKHPIACSLRKYCESMSVDVPEGLIANEIPGKGIEAVLDNTSILIGNASLLFEHNVTTRVPDKQGSVIYVAVNNNYCGYILFNNKIRKNAFDVIEKLKLTGIKNTVLLSCDLRSIVRPIANTLGFSVTKSEIMPEDKISITEYFMNNSAGNNTVLYLGNEGQELEPSKHANICMVSDAINDKELLSQADIISLGGGFASMPSTIRYSYLCKKMSFFSLWLYLGIRFILTLFMLFNVYNIIVYVILIFVISILESFISTFLFKKV